jgi:phosphate transport system substrate-binding protein
MSLRVAVAIAVAVSTVLAGCTSGAERGGPEVAIVGSDTMLVLNRRLAEGFMRREPGTAVRVTGGGSGVGVDALVAATADIAAVSRPLDPSEVQALYRTHGTLGVRFRIARDGVSVFLNPDNPVRDLSLAELAGVFTGRITSWSEVGGPPIPVRLVVRPPNSGTTRFVRDHVLAGASFASGATVAPTTRAVVGTVAEDIGAIGYGGVAYRTDAVVTCRIDGVDPDAGSIRDERYPLARYLQLVTVAPPEGAVRRFLDFCLGPGGQQVVAESGYLPLWSPEAGTSAIPSPDGPRN